MNPRSTLAFNILLVAISLLTMSTVSAQVFWSENFGQTAAGACDQGNLANGFISSNGVWQMTDLVAPDPFANTWYISAAEAGLPSGSCNIGGCWNAPSETNRSLHIGTVVGAPNVICPTGDCGALYDPGGFQPNVVACDRRIESPVIDCSNRTSVQLTFDYLMNGEANDYCTVEYFDGTVWTQIDQPPTTTICGTGNGTWTSRLLSLPLSADNNPSVKIGFRWRNDNGGAGVNPSVAVDSIQLISISAPTNSNFFASDSVICAGDCISYTAQTDAATAWSWIFVGGNPGTSTSQNPTNICYASPGFYTTIMIAYSATGNDTVTKSNYINAIACTGPVADFSASDTSFCERSCIDFFDNSINDPNRWEWQFPGAFPVIASNAQNPVGICYPTPGTYDVLLIVENDFGIDSLLKSVYINVESCPVPDVNFSASSLTACANECIYFQDQTSFTDSTSTWNWYFPGALVDTSSLQQPGCIRYDHDGYYDVQLIVTNQYGSDTLVLYSYIKIESVPTAFVGPDTAMFFGNSYQLLAGGGINYIWTPAIGLDDPLVSDPIATPNETTTYTCTISDTSGCRTIRQVTVTILHNNDFFVPTAFSPNGDGRNDYLFVRGNNLRNMRFSVFDRWGVKLFETESTFNGWDGTFKNKAVDPGVYTWVLSLEYDDNTLLTETGTTTLLR